MPGSYLTRPCNVAAEPDESEQSLQCLSFVEKAWKGGLCHAPVIGLRPCKPFQPLPVSSIMYR